MAEPVIRKRKSRSTGQRVRTGCLTCKARRVKCDEKRPTCQRCRDSRRKCGGYEDRGDTPEQSGAERQFASGSASAAGRSRSRHRSQRATEAFEYFQQHTAPALDYYFFSDFWARIVLPMSQTEAAIHYAILAVGAAHAAQRLPAGAGGYGTRLTPEDVEAAESDAINAERFALESYNRAIQALNTKLTSEGPQAVRVVLVSCILFVCLESLNGQPGRAIRHIESGRRILNDWSRRMHASEGDAPVSLDRDEMWKELWRVYSRLHHCVLLVTESGTDEADDVLGFGAGPDTNSQDPGTLRTLAEAQDALDNFSKRAFRFLKVCGPVGGEDAWPRPPELAPERQRLADCVRNFNVRFTAYIATSVPAEPSTRFLQAAAMVRVHARVLKVLVDAALGANATSTAEREPDLAGIVDECERAVLQMPPLDASPGTSRASSIYTVNPASDAPEYAPRAPGFTLACGGLAALYFVVQASRARPTRLRAVALLRAVNSNDGIWASATVARIAERVLAAEEAESFVPATGGPAPGLLEMGKRLGVLDDEGGEADASPSRTGSLAA